MLPRPPLANPPPPCNLPPPHPGDRHFHVFLVNMYCAGLCCPSALRMALHCFSHYFKSSTCVCSVIFSLQRRCMGVLCCYFRPKMFTPVDHESARLSRLEAVALESPKSPESRDVTPLAPQPQTTAQPHTYPEVLYRSFGSSITFVLDEAHWHQRESRFTRVLFACISGGYHSLPRNTLAIPPPPPGDRHLATVSPPPPGRPSRANPGVCKGGGG